MACSIAPAPSRLRSVAAFLLCVILTSYASAGQTVSIWLVSNGFHTSLGLLADEAPFTRSLLPGPRPDAVLIGWGAKDFYRGRTNPWTLGRAIISSPSALHLVPVHGFIRRRFAHSDVVRLKIPCADYSRLLQRLESAFARDNAGHAQLLGTGYYPDSRFYVGRERFYFPNVCNVWLAATLRHCGLPIFLPTTIFPSDLIRQSARLGHRESRRSQPLDDF